MIKNRLYLIPFVVSVGILSSESQAHSWTVSFNENFCAASLQGLSTVPHADSVFSATISFVRVRPGRANPLSGEFGIEDSDSGLQVALSGPYDAGIELSDVRVIQGGEEKRVTIHDDTEFEYAPFLLTGVPAENIWKSIVVGENTTVGFSADGKTDYRISVVGKDVAIASAMLDACISASAVFE